MSFSIIKSLTAQTTFTDVIIAEPRITHQGEFRSVSNVSVRGDWVGTLTLQRRFVDEGEALSQTFVVVGASTTDLTVTAHTFTTDEGPFLLSTSGTLPTGLSLTTEYYIKTVDADTVQVSLSYSGSAVTFTADSGSGTHTFNNVWRDFDTFVSTAGKLLEEDFDMLEDNQFRLGFKTGDYTSGSAHIRLGLGSV